MNKLSSLILILILVYSCKEENVNQEVRADFAHKSQLDSNYIDSVRTWFIGASATDRYDAWVNKLNDDLKNNSWTTGQEKLIEDLIGFLELSYFEHDWEETNAFNNFISSWMNAATSEGLSYSDQGRLIALLAPYSGSGGPGLGRTNMCDCNEGDDWCMFLSPADSECSDNCTDETSSGCGTLWLDICNSDCT